MMDTPSATPNNSGSLGFINAKAVGGRLVRVQANSFPAKPHGEPKQVQLQTTTASTFEIGLDDPVSPKVLNVSIELRVILKFSGTEQVFFDYEAKHEMQFAVLAWTGFTDWTELPSQALTPYIATVHDIAIRRAEATINEMGIRTGAIPRPESFDSPDGMEVGSTEVSS